MIKLDTEFQPVFPYPTQFLMLIPTLILPLCMLLQYPSINPGLWLFSPVFPIHSTASIGRGSTALGAVKSDEPSLAAAATSCQIEVSLVNNKEGSVILGFIEGTILQQNIKTPLLVFLFT